MGGGHIEPIGPSEPGQVCNLIGMSAIAYASKITAFLTKVFFRGYSESF